MIKNVYDASSGKLIRVSVGGKESVTPRNVVPTRKVITHDFTKPKINVVPTPQYHGDIDEEEQPPVQEQQQRYTPPKKQYHDIDLAIERGEFTSEQYGDIRDVYLQNSNRIEINYQ